MDTPRLPLLVGLLATSLTAQAAFTQLSPANMPSPRAGSVGVTDGGVLYNFGGKPGPGVEFNDMWLFDGTDWTDITPTSGPLPPERDFYAATYDTSRNRYVLFGGRSSALGANLSDTWEFDGTSWTQLTPAVAPSARRWCQMVFDPGSGVSYLFGGFDSGAYFNDTWSWDGTNWTQLSPPNSPSARGRGRFSYDFLTGQMIYFGGRAATAFGDTWSWDGSNWTEIVTANAPGQGGVVGRFAYGMTYDLVRNRHVLFGGTRTGATLSDVWEFDGTDWTERYASGASGPTSRTGATVTYVLGLQKTIMFGGFGGPQVNDTWEYQTSAVASANSYGAGCPGPGGALTLTSVTEPWTDSTWVGACQTLGATSLALEVYGLATALVPLNAVLPIAPVGCDLLNSAELIGGPLLPAAGVATTQLPIPNTPILAGVTLQAQIAEMEFDAGGNWIGLYTSNGQTLTIGVR